MIKIENIETYGWETAIRGMRNPMNSWDRSDSIFGCSMNHSDECLNPKEWSLCEDCTRAFVGDNDMKLMKALFKGGTEHRKYLRFINVTMDVTAPLYWWKEFDTYKIGTNCNSCSTMHKIHAKEFTWDDFSLEHLVRVRDCKFGEPVPTLVMKTTIDALNYWRDRYLTALKTEEETGLSAKDVWWQMIQLLPSSYNQRRTIQMNYEVAVRIIEQRNNHKLDEWHDMVEVLLNLPYMKEIMGVE